MRIVDKDFGTIEVTTLALPPYVKNVSATYTATGTVLVDYKRDGDAEGFIRVAVVGDDGSGFREIFAGVIPQHPHANGIRFMPYKDGKRVLLGDYVMECSPNIDNCENVAVIPVEYPWGIKDDPRTFKHWSEVIISPDDVHICWTALLGEYGGALGFGALTRESDRYVITDAQFVEFSGVFKDDPEREGYKIPLPMRGGEVKQFIQGGAGISLVGAKDGALPDSVTLDLLTGETARITKTPGYDETTMFSPDEKLGLVMSTRGSEKTNCAVIGLLPRPHAALVTMRLSWPVYAYSVSGVRGFREGNVGPVLINVEKSVNEDGYQGVQLNEPDSEWVYCSPISWNPNGKKVMWPEMLRGSNDGHTSTRRIRIAELLDVQLQSPVSARQTPDDMPFCTRDASKLWQSQEQDVTGKIAGKRSGYITHTRRGGISLSEYHGYSDDGENVYDGYEKAERTADGENVYEAEIKLTGAKRGEMSCRLTFSDHTNDKPTKLLFGTGGDNKPKSYGFAEYGGKRIDVASMPE